MHTRLQFVAQGEERKTKTINIGLVLREPNYSGSGITFNLMRFLLFETSFRITFKYGRNLLMH